MKLKYKFKIDSPLDFWDIPARIYFMAATLFFLIPFYLIGFLTVKDDFPHRTGIVNRIHILQKSHSGWEANFTLEGDTSHTYWQGYENSYPFFLFPPKYKLDDYIIHKGDTISFFIDNDKNGNYIKSDRFFPGEGHSFESDEVIYTEGLVVNGKEIASPLVAAFIRTPLTWLGNVGVICFYLWMCLFVIDFGMWYNKKNIDKKIKKYFYNQNMFIR